MARLVLVRHGRPAAVFGDHPDPGLAPEGRDQARAMAEAVAPLGPLPIVTSSLRRTRETAAALEERWGLEARVEPAVAEIPSPGGDPAARVSWLRGVLSGRWADLDPALRRWRDELVAWLVARPGDGVVVTHFVAINVAVGAATGDDAVVGFRPGHCSRTVVEVVGGALRLVERGHEADTVVG